MKRIINKVTYSCEYCDKTFDTPKEASIHENSCENRPDLEERSLFLEKRNYRKKLIEKFYQSENIQELNENWKEYIRIFHKNIDVSKIKVSLDRLKMGKMDYAYLIRFNCPSNPYYYLNHQVDTKIENFPKIIAKIEKLKQAEKDCNDNYNIQANKFSEKEQELKLLDKEYQNHLKNYNKIFKDIEELQKQAKEINNKLDVCNENRCLEAKKLINYIDYKEIVRNLQKDLDLK